MYRKIVHHMSINILINIYIYAHVYTTNYGKFLKRLGIPDHLAYLLRNLYAGQDATVGTRNGTMDWFKTGKGVGQGSLFSPCLLNLCS